jgi:hypothetical protein
LQSERAKREKKRSKREEKQQTKPTAQPKRKEAKEEKRKAQREAKREANTQVRAQRREERLARQRRNQKWVPEDWSQEIQEEERSRQPVEPPKPKLMKGAINRKVQKWFIDGSKYKDIDISQIELIVRKIVNNFKGPKKVYMNLMRKRIQ